MDAPGYAIITVSPRRNGNCDTAAYLFAKGFAGINQVQPEGEHSSVRSGSPLLTTPAASVHITFLREHTILPCIACGSCDITAHALVTGAPLEVNIPFGCPLTCKDQSSFFLQMLASRQGLCIIAPIYFYHLPALFKALLDRCQSFFALHAACAAHGRNPDELMANFSGGTSTGPPISAVLAKKRACEVILIGARPKGDKLFAGSLLTLKYALAPLNIELSEPLLLYGLDAPGDLTKHAEYRQVIEQYGDLAGSRYHTQEQKSVKR